MDARRCSGCQWPLSAYNTGRLCRACELKARRTDPAPTLTPVPTVHEARVLPGIERDLGFLRRALRNAIDDLKAEGNLDAERYAGIRESWQ